MYRQNGHAKTLGLHHLPKMQADYRAAKRQTRLRPRPRGVPSGGASGDYHYRSEADYLWMGELGQEMDRNNVIGARILDVQQKNVLQNGFQYDPDTGDTKLDDDLKAWWTEVSNDPQQIDAQGEFTFNTLTEFVYRAKKSAGDIFALLRDDAAIELVEFHRCRTPSGKQSTKIVHGIELDGSRRRKRYWFTKEAISPLSRSLVKKADMKAIAAYDGDGLPQVLHVYDPKRATQTRGITGFAPIFDFLGMHDDLEFLQMVKAQMASMVLLIRNRAAEFDPASLSNTPPGGTTPSATMEDLMQQELRPGAQLAGMPGENLMLSSANVPNAEFFQHMKLILSLCGVSFYVPLVQLMLDASETNFSGYRGAISEARLAYRCEQDTLARQWHAPVLTFELHQLSNNDKAFGKIRERSRFGRGKVNLFKHKWKKPRWAYIEPMKDATAALVRTSNMLTSPSRQATEDGSGEWADIVAETVKDRALAIRAAIKTSTEINAEHELSGNDLVRWRDLAPLAVPERVNVSVQQDSPASAESTEPTKPKEPSNAEKQ